MERNSDQAVKRSAGLILEGHTILSSSVRVKRENTEKKNEKKPKVYSKLTQAMSKSWVSLYVVKINKAKVHFD